jgi:UDP-N-acetylglucosamine 2-epimerase (non-hydrolysing)
MAPIVHAARAAGAQCTVVSTGQHKEMLEPLLDLLDLTPQHRLEVMRSGQGLAGMTARMLTGLDTVLAAESPDVVVVQGDTTSTLAGALASFYRAIPVAHVEAGLRSGRMDNPFPEEGNRRLVAPLARWHFPPTPGAASALVSEGVPPESVHVTGNTGIDTLLATRSRRLGMAAFGTHRPHKVLLTLHRRENQGPVMEGIAAAIATLAGRGDVEVVLPLHKSPAVRAGLDRLRQVDGVTVVEPLEYPDFTATMAASRLILTDSGGVQEEAPSLGKPILVLRETTERPEAIQAGCARLVGTDPSAVLAETVRLLDDDDAYADMAYVANPFGDGTAGVQIVSRILDDLEHRSAEAA